MATPSLKLNPAPNLKVLIVDWWESFMRLLSNTLGSRLSDEDEEGTHLRLVEIMQTMKAYVAANCGRVAHLAGDAIMAELKDVGSALHCAINMQLATRCARTYIATPWPGTAS